MFKTTAILTADTVGPSYLLVCTHWMRKFYTHTKNTTLHLSFKVSDGGYESDDESIWWSEEEQTDIYNYGERLKKHYKEVVYTYVWRTKHTKIIIWPSSVIPPMTKKAEN